VSPPQGSSTHPTKGEVIGEPEEPKSFFDKLVKGDMPKEEKVLHAACGIDEDDEDEDEEDEWEEMIMIGPDGNSEWGGPLRGGRNPEPTRFGDWERKGRCTDF
jgi:hypothetical protein